MVERKIGIEPRLRPGEILPNPKPGFVPTRVNGEIILVSEQSPQDTFYGKSPYTQRQVSEIDNFKLKGVRPIDQNIQNQ